VTSSWSLILQQCVEFLRYALCALLLQQKKSLGFLVIGLVYVYKPAVRMCVTHQCIIHVTPINALSYNVT